MTQRERLIELLQNAPERKRLVPAYAIEKTADYLLANGVVVPVRCEECRFSHFIKSCSKYECEKCSGFLRYSNDFCSYGERKGGDE